eukprot:TRINITY_DN10808_c0_g1_i1.p1 TRINITY_DN10808_c0_g1~~TRINITY_DN10808_c0_g1_i1.p1  ORF type:complete len:556 (+),score=249.71 TRINITY_DN10808_c0_g1_i1:125-1792(+)
MATKFFLASLLVILSLLVAVQANPFDILANNAQSLVGDMIVERINHLASEASASALGATNFLSEIVEIANAFDVKTEKISQKELQYFRFIPQYKSSIISSGAKWSTSCFGDVQGSYVVNNGTAKISITSDKVRGVLCEDFYFIATMESFKLFNVKGKGTESLEWKIDHYTASEQYDLGANGFRVFLFSEGRIKSLEAVIKTVELFVPEMKGPGVQQEYAEMNVEFINGYTDFDFAPRTNGTIVNIDPSTISSGDFIGITRLDGLDPMIVWGQGGTTGHTTVALEIDGELNICESTVTDVYWPTDGVQCTPWPKWLDQARNASFNFVHVPLSPQMKAKFNVTAAVDFFKSVEGLPYGYNNFLFGWLDTTEDNYPCLPPKYEDCLSSHFMQVLAGIVDRFDPPLAHKMFNQALNKRINNDFKTTAEISQYAETELGLTFGQLLAIPEQDNWVYDQGKSMVCDVFVCSVWKAAGLFGDMTDQFQCSELTPRDVYSLNVFDGSYNRPQQCVDADPKSPLCQLGGNYTLLLPGYNTKNPYPNMGNNCPGVPPVYKQPANC